MDFVSVRFITPDVKRLTSFYAQITGLSPTWYTEDFAELSAPTCTLAIGSTRTLALFGSPESSARGPAIIEFRVDNVDTKYEEIAPAIDDLVQAPKTMPWGNRSLLFRDPDGNLVNFFTPVTPQAIAKLAR